MSQAKLTLRPPPNIDFVQGYPGIPPGAPDRPQAAVKGAIEVRVGPGGVKAKWVRIELRKVETLPGGGLANTFFDFVGQSPINLWQASGEYAPLQTQDFPFYIRIPESIPPSIALERGAGIKYELIATLCIKGKKGFLRRDKHIILSTSAPIVIDKHELHSTWPVYAQPETRNLGQDGITLTVDRSQACYGPGDRISVNATVKSAVMHTVILRGFEFLLRETTVFRAGGNAHGKKAVPQVKPAVVNEQKVPVNATLYGGAMHKAELAVTIPTHHTSTTLNAARHIDITYVLTVRALLSTGKPIILDLPVVVSNWPRSVSLEAVRRIGLASNVSAHAQTPGRPVADMAVIPAAQQAAASPIAAPPRQATLNHPYMNPTAQVAPTVTDSSSEAAGPAAGGNFNTAPAAYNGRADEFGVARPRGQTMDQSGLQTIGGSQVAGATARPRSGSGRPAPAANRLTVTNYGDDMPEEVKAQNMAQMAARQQQQQQQQQSRNGSFSARSGTTAKTNGWMPAEEEKKRLYENAMAKVEVAHQGNIPRAISPPLEVIAPTPVRNVTSVLQSNSSGSTSKPSGFLTAEEEKARLFNSAQDAVRRTQGVPIPANAASPPPASTHSRSTSLSSQAGMSAGAALYSQAIQSMQRNASTGHSSLAPSGASSPAPGAAGGLKRPTPGYMSADEEKLALKRYYDAKAAVHRTQGNGYETIPEQATSPTPPPASSFSPPAPAPAPTPAPAPSSTPIPYNALYANNRPVTIPAQNPTPPGPGELPPAFSSGPNGQPSYISEKEKLRRAYEAQDAAALAARSPPKPAPAPAPAPLPDSTPPGYYASAPPPFMPQANGVNGALSEKEILRRKFEQQDAAAMASAPPPATPPRTDGGRALPVPRAQPSPPGYSTGSRPLTAVEEKARLKAMYASEDRSAGPPARIASPVAPASPYVNGMNGMNGVNGTNGVNGMNGVNGSGLYRHQSATVNGAAPNYNTIPPPPPLMPRPPKEYIQETQHEDKVMAAKIEALDRHVQNGESAHTSPELRPFSTPNGSYNNSPTFARADGSRPPIPPKMSMDDT